MDYIPSMFKDDQSTDQELSHLISTLSCKLDEQYEHLHLHHRHEIQEDHDQVPPPTPSQDGRDLTLKRRRSSSIAFGEKDQNPNDKKKKKLKHREIERQRRQEMAALYASLRSLIPVEYLKGKRSVSDQMHEAANYLKDLQKKIQELCGKRDELRKLSDSTSSSNSNCTNCNIESDEQTSKRHSSEAIISVVHSRAGVEVVINTAFEQGLPLARVLQVLVGEGLDVVSCVSAKVNERFLHTIESEALSNEKSMDLPELEQKLKKLII